LARRYLAFGVLLILVVLVLPRGIAGGLVDLAARARSGPRAAWRQARRR